MKPVNFTTRLRVYPTIFRPKTNWTRIVIIIVCVLLLLALGHVLISIFNKMQEPIFYPNVAEAETITGNPGEIEKESIPGEVKEEIKVEKLSAEFSAYTSEVGQTDSTPYETADGTNLKTFNGCVVAVNSYAFGTKLDIDGIGVCEVHDRMNKRYSNKNMDIYMGDDKPRALKFGRKKLNYTIL